MIRNASFLEDVLAGLAQPEKSIPSKYFYDRRGSQLFDQICELDEYYPARTESSLMNLYADEMADSLGADCVLIELGSGSSVKTRYLLDHAIDLRSYIPIDISEAHLHQTARELQADYPLTDIHPVAADFTCPASIELPDRSDARRIVYFPGSTLGNFEPLDAAEILSGIQTLCRQDGGLLIGIDLHKETTVLEAAYDDRDGITAAFNLNLLVRINRELGGDFDLDQFKHQANYDTDHRRIEMRLVSKIDQHVAVADELFSFDEGETILTEYSHKYSIDGFIELARGSGLRHERTWTDAEHRFAIMFFNAKTRLSF